MSKVNPTEILSNWNRLIPNMQQSAAEFYQEIEKLIGAHNLKDVKVERVDLAEGGFLSKKREYLQVQRDDLVFHVCAAPYGNGFFVSYWFGKVESEFVAALKTIPFLGGLIRAMSKPWTYYRVDTANMFSGITSGAVEYALDTVMGAKGMQVLTQEEKRPTMRDFFKGGQIAST